MKKAVILFSGGLDSTTCLAIAKSQGFECHALTVNYGQRHTGELTRAAKIAEKLKVASHRMVTLDTGLFAGSSLTDQTIPVPDHQSLDEIPNTYVPARNTIFIAMALAYAESIHSFDIFFGANFVDYSHYPDCRDDYLQAYQHLAKLATKVGREGNAIRIHAPLLYMSKGEIVKTGLELNIDYALTVTCYRLNEKGEACGTCDGCVFRKKGFREAGIPDPTCYQCADHSELIPESI